MHGVGVAEAMLAPSLLQPTRDPGPGTSAMGTSNGLCLSWYLSIQKTGREKNISVGQGTNRNMGSKDVSLSSKQQKNPKSTFCTS